MASPNTNSKGSAFLAVTVFLALVLGGVLSLYLAAPPAPIPASAPPTEFSAERALAMNREFSSLPHPGGSPQNEKSRDYICATLKSIGIEPVVYRGAYVDGHSVVSGVDVLARIPGTANTKAVALEAHYDSVPYGPGATDDCGGAAAMLEAARAIKAGPPLKNDVILNFSDGEECGLLGAKIFGKHPWFKEVGVFLNFEARGNRGASMMFETSDQNGWLIDQLIQAGGEPRANSMMYDVYKRMPFASDLNALKPLGAKGLNMAFVGNFAHYHTMNDNPDNMSLASLQHHGTYALSLARQFGNVSLDNVTAPDVVYFNTLGPHMVTYSFFASRGFALIAGLAFAGMLVFGFMRRHLSVGGILAGILAFIVTAACAAAATLLLLWPVYGLQQLYAFYRVDITQLPDLRALYFNDEYITAFSLIAVGLAALLYNTWRRIIRTQNLAVGALAIWLTVMVGVQMYLPGGAYLFYWPLLLTSIALTLVFTSEDTERLPAGRIALATLFILPSVMLWLPTYQSAFITLMVMASPALVMVPCLLAGLLIPQLDLMARPNKRLLPFLFTAGGLLLWGYALFANTPSALHPNLDCLSYAVNLDSGNAYWLSSDAKTDEWTSQFFPAGTERKPLDDLIPGNHEVCFRAPAPKAELTGINVEKVSDEVRQGLREVRFVLTCPDHPSTLRFSVSGPEVFSATLLGEEVKGNKDEWNLHFNLMPQEGVDLALKVDASKPLQVKTLEEHLILPASITIPPRPKHIVPEPNTVRRHKSFESQRTFVTRTFNFPVPEPPAPAPEPAPAVATPAPEPPPAAAPAEPAPAPEPPAAVPAPAPEPPAAAPAPAPEPPAAAPAPAPEPPAAAPAPEPPAAAPAPEPPAAPAPEPPAAAPAPEPEPPAAAPAPAPEPPAAAPAPAPAPEPPAAAPAPAPEPPAAAPAPASEPPATAST